MTFFDCTADLVGQLNGNGQKGMLQIDAPLSKISGYANGVRLFLRLSVCPVDRWRLSRRAAGLLLGSGGKCRSTAAGAYSGQRHAESRGARFNADWV